MTPVTEQTSRSPSRTPTPPPKPPAKRLGPGPTALAPRRRDLEPGAILAGRYRVERRVGAGATGEVWAGEHLAIGVPVAIKRLPPSAQDDRETSLRFKREAYLCGRIRSDSVARVLDLVEDDRYGMAIVMEFIEGDSLAKVLAGRKMTLEQTVELGADIASALCHLHRAHVVHRDLKPGNIILERTDPGRRRPVLVDFGASRMVSAGEDSGGADDTLTSITRVDMAIGTLEYMAPEQILNARDVTAACDAYALGAILFRAASGGHVYGDLSQGKLVREKLLTDAPPLCTGRTDAVARGLEKFVAKALARQPSDRFASGEAMAAELLALRDLARAAEALDEPTVDDAEALPFELVARSAFAEVSPDELIDEDTAPTAAIRREAKTVPPPTQTPVRAALVSRPPKGVLAAALLAVVVGGLCLRTALRSTGRPAAPERAQTYFLRK